jgi:hypothetical protein
LGLDTGQTQKLQTNYDGNILFGIAEVLQYGFAIWLDIAFTFVVA